MCDAVLNVEPRPWPRAAILREAGLDVTDASSGEEAIACVLERAPALVVLDLELPDIDAVDVCRRIKANAASAQTLVVLVSSTVDEAATRKRALDAGADGSLRRGLAPDELVAQVRVFLRLAAAERTARDRLSALQESDRRYRNLVESSPEGIFVNQKGRVVYANAAAAALFRASSPDALVGRTALSLFHPRFHSLIQNRIADLEAGKAVPVVEEQIVALDGAIRDVDVAASGFGPADSTGIQVILRDATERKEAERQLRLNEERFRRLIEVSSEIVWIAEPDGSIAQDSPTWRAFTGKSYDDWKGSNWLSSIHPDDRASLEAAWREAVRTGGPYTPEFRLWHHSGEYRHLSCCAVPVRNEDGTVREWIGLNTDIHERKLLEQHSEAQRRLAEDREAEIESIYDSAPIGLCIFDREGRYLRINRRLAEMNGLPPEAHLGRSFRDVLPDLAPQGEALFRRIIETGEPVLGVEVAGEVHSEPGVRRTWLENWVPVKDAAGNTVGINVGVEDITALKRVAAELREANRVKDEFLATLSHELRTPLTAILGWADMIEGGRLDAATTRRALQAIARNAHIQRQLVSDVLDVSRMTSGKLRLEMREVEVSEVLNRAVSSVLPAIEAKQIHLTLTSNTTNGARALGDPERLQQVIWNLLSNAVKFTPIGGQISLTTALAGDRVELSVADTGCGIAPAFLPVVFDRFVQADSSHSRRHGGLGLGLSIVKQLVEMHGGRVSASSDGEDRGATFVVSLPALRVPVAVRRSESDANRSRSELAGLRVLILDDQDDARLLLSAIIEQAGGTPFLASCGADALAGLPFSRPDLILADLGMPEMDGYEFLRRLRESTYRPVPVVALTAYSSLADRRRTLAAGFVEHLSKPVTAAELLGVVERVCRRATNV